MFYRPLCSGGHLHYKLGPTRRAGKNPLYEKMHISGILTYFTKFAVCTKDYSNHISSEFHFHTLFGSQIHKL